MALNSHEALKKAGVRTCQNEMQRVRVANEPEKTKEKQQKWKTAENLNSTGFWYDLFYKPLASQATNRDSGLGEQLAER